MHDLVLIIYSFFALFLLLISSPPHWRSGNVGAVCLVIWAFMGCLGYLFNSLVWWDNVENHSPVWCDICESNEPKVELEAHSPPSLPLLRFADFLTSTSQGPKSA